MFWSVQGAASALLTQSTTSLVLTLLLLEAQEPCTHNETGLYFRLSNQDWERLLHGRSLVSELTRERFSVNRYLRLGITFMTSLQTGLIETRFDGSTGSTSRRRLGEFQSHRMSLTLSHHQAGQVRVLQAKWGATLAEVLLRSCDGVLAYLKAEDQLALGSGRLLASNDKRSKKPRGKTRVVTVLHADA